VAVDQNSTAKGRNKSGFWTTLTWRAFAGLGIGTAIVAALVGALINQWANDPAPDLYLTCNVIPTQKPVLDRSIPTLFLYEDGYEFADEGNDQGTVRITHDHLFAIRSWYVQCNLHNDGEKAAIEPQVDMPISTLPPGKYLATLPLKTIDAGANDEFNIANVGSDDTYGPLPQKATYSYSAWFGWRRDRAIRARDCRFFIPALTLKGKYPLHIPMPTVVTDCNGHDSF
jgi:hypothetical protein